jgi:hypothetical protein
MRIGKLRLFEKKTIGVDYPGATPLLHRYILFRIPSFGIYLHHLLRSDYERSLHCHPFTFVSLIIKGQYIEHHDQTRDGKEVAALRPRWSLLYRPAEWRHRLEMDSPVWTMVFVGRRRRPWGFYLPDGWCWWRKHNPALNICEDEILWHGGSD